MHLKLQPSQVLHFLKEWSLCYNLPSLLPSGSWGVTQHSECREQSAFRIRIGVCCPRMRNRFPGTGGRGAEKQQIQE